MTTERASRHARPAALAFLVLSSWCLGVLSRHRRLLLSYTALAAWNAVTIVGSIVHLARVNGR